MLEAKGFRTPTWAQVTERLKRLRGYTWSSCRAYAGYCPPPRCLTTTELWSRAHEDPAGQPAAVRALLTSRVTYGAEPSDVERLRDVIAIGGAAFSRRIREPVVGNDQGLAQKRALRRRVKSEEVRARVEELRGENWDAFPARRNDWSRALFLWGVRRRCGFTLREVGEAAGGMAPAAVDMAIRRLDQRARHTPEIAALQRKSPKALNVDVL